MAADRSVIEPANVFRDVQLLVDDTVNIFIQTTFNNIWSALNGPMTAFMTLFVVLYGYSLWRGLIQIPAQDALKWAVLLSIIYALVSQWPVFNNWVVETLIPLPDDLAGAVVGAGEGVSASESLGKAYSDITEVANQALRDSGDLAILAKVLGLVTMLLGTILVIVALYHLVKAKILLAVLVGVAPIFLVCVLFSPTRKMFEAWLKQVINYALVVLFVVAIIGLTKPLLQSALDNLSSEEMSWLGALVPFVMLVLVALLINEAGNLATAIAGGIGLSTSTAAMNHAGQKMASIGAKPFGLAAGFVGKKIKSGWNRYRGGGVTGS